MLKIQCHINKIEAPNGKFVNHFKPQYLHEYNTIQFDFISRKNLFKRLIDVILVT